MKNTILLIAFSIYSIFTYSHKENYISTPKRGTEEPNVQQNLNHYEIKQLKVVHQIFSPDTTTINIPDMHKHLKSDVIEVDGTDLVYTIVEIMPEYEGGDDARNRFLAENIVYPQKALDHGIQGTVYVSFIIEADGAISNVKLLKGIGGGCDEESIRVVKLLAKWKPGMQAGKNVRVLFNMPIYYKLQGRTKIKHR